MESMTTATEIFRQGWRARLLPLLILALVLLVNVIVRVRLLDAPLERDEGEHAYTAQTMLAGNAPWKLAYNMKLPGTDAVYVLFMAVFGQTPTGIRLGLLLANTAAILLVALLGARLFGTSGGTAAGASYGLLAASQNVVGTVAHSVHLVALFSTLALLLLLKTGSSYRWVFGTGLVFGLTFLMKQPGLAFAVFGAGYLAWQLRQQGTALPGLVNRLAVFGAGVILPYGLVCLALWRAGVFERFWFWTVTLARAYATQRTFVDQLRYFIVAMVTVPPPNILFWLMAIVGLVLAYRNQSTRRAAVFTGLLLLFSFLAVSAGGVFNANYFIMMFPALALAVGGCVAAGELSADTFMKRASLLAFAVACLYSVAAQRAYLFSMTPYQFSRGSYGLNPFPEAVKLGEYIRTHSDSRAQVAVLGSEAEIYFYSQRRAATGYLFTYGLMEPHQYAAILQGDMISEIEAARPEFIVHVAVPESWMTRPESSRAIFYWTGDYVRKFYDTVGVIELPMGAPIRYLWGKEAQTYKQGDQRFVMLFQRRK